MKNNVKYLSLVGLMLLVGCSSRYYIYNTITSEQFEVYICYTMDGQLRYTSLDRSERVTTLATHLICKRFEK